MNWPKHVDPSGISLIQAGWSGLDDVADSQIPQIAAWWLAEGYDTPELRELAALDEDAGYRIRTLIPEVLESLGYGASWRQNLISSVLTGPIDVALEFVQHDLDVSGLHDHRISLSEPWLDVDEMPSFVVAYNGGWSTEVTHIETGAKDLAIVTMSVAASTQDSLIQSGEHIRWPLCLHHNVIAAPRASNSGHATWWCKNDSGHELARIGELARPV